MTYQESLHILAILEVAYPNLYRNLPDEKAKLTAQLWASSFADIDGKLVIEGVKAFIVSDASGFAPTIGQVRKLITTKGGNDSLSEMEAWSLVNRAMSRSGYESVSEFKKLPPVVQQAVGSPANLREWALMPADEVQSVISSHFMRTYRAKLKVAEFNDSLPEATKKRLGILLDPEKQQSAYSNHQMPEQSPCYECEERVPACHDRCEKHQAWKARRESQKIKYPGWRMWKRSWPQNPVGFRRRKK